MAATIISYITDHIEGHKKSVIMRGLLYTVSEFFKLGVQIRNFAFDRHFIKETKVDIPVISIGNIIAGGTGKTALVRKLGKNLSRSKRVSVLLRGYRSAIERSGGSLQLMERSDITPKVCGDEAYLLWKQLPALTFFVGKDRRLNAQRAAYHEADVVLLDDGMQYRSLHRDLEIVMLHGDDLYGKGFYLPRGYLRDSPKRLAKADYIFINHIQGSAHFHSLKKEVEKHTSAPLIGVQMIPQGAFGRGDEVWEDISGKRVAVFCGLGKPHSFFKTVEDMNVEIVEKLILPDHVFPTMKQLVNLTILAEEKGCELILCSEKDWVKLPDTLEVSLPLAQVKASMEVVAGESHYNQLLLDIANLINRSRS